eukprot:scaffold291_cov332-Pavlova_lutheri.AAC.10
MFWGSNGELWQVPADEMLTKDVLVAQHLHRADSLDVRNFTTVVHRQFVRESETKTSPGEQGVQPHVGHEPGALACVLDAKRGIYRFAHLYGRFRRVDLAGRQHHTCTLSRIVNVIGRVLDQLLSRFDDVLVYIRLSTELPVLDGLGVCGMVVHFDLHVVVEQLFDFFQEAVVTFVFTDVVSEFLGHLDLFLQPLGEGRDLSVFLARHVDPCLSPFAPFRRCTWLPNHGIDSSFFCAGSLARRARCCVRYRGWLWALVGRCGVVDGFDRRFVDGGGKKGEGRGHKGIFRPWEFRVGWWNLGVDGIQVA